jgi:hypothetical protein
MLGIGGSTSSPPPKVAPKEKDRTARKPEGMSREVFALLSTWKETPDNVVEPKTVVPGRSTFKVLFVYCLSLSHMSLPPLLLSLT